MRGIGITSDPNAAYKLIVGDETVFDNKSLSSALNEDYKRLRLEPGTWVIIEARSTNGIAITVDASITGEQILKF